MTDNIISSPIPEDEHTNAILLRMLEDVAAGRYDGWSARLADWAVRSGDPVGLLAAFSAGAVLRWAWAIEGQGEQALADYIADAHATWPGVPDE